MNKSNNKKRQASQHPLDRVVKWPRGRYNGQRIDGFFISFKLHLLWWHWKPVFSWNYGNPYLIWLCVSLRAEPSYRW